MRDPIRAHIKGQIGLGTMKGNWGPETIKELSRVNGNFFSKNGRGLDEAADSLVRAGLVPEGYTADDLVQHLSKPVAGSKGRTLFQLDSESERVKKVKAIQEMPAAEVTSGVSLDKKSAEGMVRSFGKMENQYDSRVAEIPVATIGKIINHKGFDVSTILPDIPNLYKTAIHGWSEKEIPKEGHRPHSNIASYHHYVNKFTDGGGEEYYIRFAVTERKGRQGKQGDSHVHSTIISEVAVYKNKDGYQQSVPGTYPVLSGSPSFVDKKLQDFFNSVKSERITDTPAFRNWFGDSKVVDENGEPLVVYHGTASDIAEFQTDKATDKEGRRLEMGWGKGKFYFTDSPEAASNAAEWAAQSKERPGNAPAVMPVYLRIVKPIEATEYMRLVQQEQDAGKTRDKAIAAVDKKIQAKGFDGIIDRVSGGMAAFSPTQIKSVNNRGTFNPADPRILFQAEPIDEHNMVALHNMSEDNVLDAASLGGLPLPSLGIANHETPFSGYGNITLIGTRDMIDPAATPVFSADAYTARRPALVWNKVKTSKAQAFVDKYDEIFRSVGDTRTLDYAWDALVNSPNREEIKNHLSRSSGAKAAFLASKGEQAEIIQSAVRSTEIGSMSAPVQRLIAENENINPSNHEDLVQISTAFREHIETVKSESLKRALLKTGGDYFDENGLLRFGAADSLVMAAKQDRPNVGKTVTDVGATSAALDKRVPTNSPDFQAWISLNVPSVLSLARSWLRIS